MLATDMEMIYTADVVLRRVDAGYIVEKSRFSNIIPVLSLVSEEQAARVAADARGEGGLVVVIR